MTALCPYLTCTKNGALVVRGRARFPEGTIAPAATSEWRSALGWDAARGRYLESAPVPPSVIYWEGEHFTARFERMNADLLAHVFDALGEAMHEGQTRTDGAPASGDCVWRIDAMTWEAPAELGADDHISGSPGRLVVRDGRPAAVEVDAAHVDDLRESEAAFRAVFAGKAELGSWSTTEVHVPGRPAAWGAVVRARAEVGERAPGGNLIAELRLGHVDVEAQEVAR